MSHCHSANEKCSTIYFDEVFETGFEYDNQEYITTTHPEFKIGDKVHWQPRFDNFSLTGKIEFIGKARGTTENENMDCGISAVVIFNNPTCNLRGHIASPPSNRNLIPLQELRKCNDDTQECVAPDMEVPSSTSSDVNVDVEMER